jgi:hypothetical protein
MLMTTHDTIKMDNEHMKHGEGVVWILIVIFCSMYTMSRVCPSLPDGCIVLAFDQHFKSSPPPTSIDL